MNMHTGYYAFRSISLNRVVIFALACVVACPGSTLAQHGMQLNSNPPWADQQSGAATVFTVRKLPDTGQTGDYTATHGEDSDYSINVPSYTVHGDGTVTDNVTGLMWQTGDSGELLFENAARYCDTLTLGGYADWRIPACHEFFGLLNHDRLNPALDITTFVKSAAEYWWSGDRRTGDTTRVWVVNAGGGIGPHPKSETVSAGGTRRMHVRAVRNAQTPVTTAVHFSDNGDGTVTDNTTRLVWQKTPDASTMTWAQALAFAEALSLGGHDDWRLPNIKELQSINDESASNPSVDRTAFTSFQTGKYWSSTSQYNAVSNAWDVDFQYGIASYDTKTSALRVICVRSVTDAVTDSIPQSAIPGGEFEMGDHHGFVDPSHPSDETPVHKVRVNSFSMARTETTNEQFAAFLTDALAQGLIEVRSNLVYLKGGSDLLCYTHESASYASISFNGTAFSIADFRAQHPGVGVMWFGAAAYCNWRSAHEGLQQCYTPASAWACDFAKNGYRLPTEAEWEYAGRGGLYTPYRIYPTGDSIIVRSVNLPNSGDPYETGDLPYTTPAGFYNGSLRLKSTFNWPGAAVSYQTENGANAYGLYDMQGNVWEFVNDWYGQDYYKTSPYDNPTGPVTGFVMPDGKPYRGMRGGNWYNGLTTNGVSDGHSRVANRNPSYYRGPQDPNHPWYHIGFRIARRPGSSQTGLGHDAPSDPVQPRLESNHPNPFYAATDIRFSLPDDVHTTLTVHDALGRRVAILIDEPLAAGWHTVSFDGTGLPRGMYFCMLHAGAHTLVRRMLRAGE